MVVKGSIWRVEGGDVVRPDDVKELFGVSEKEKFTGDCLQ